MCSGPGVQLGFEAQTYKLAPKLIKSTKVQLANSAHLTPEKIDYLIQLFLSSGLGNPFRYSIGQNQSFAFFSDFIQIPGVVGKQVVV